ncbi:hypothetical protein [Methylobacterium indicum]|uniref:Uncharacterized protein n=1 Tax=Methylobacterium indicum TaxID=1775910 RepID=A0A8H8X140_9HYPH|nr:hypothetical protein [Methylobacterium indicum]BCM87627.1 hypothetical protein mvi_60880 [Methylobacterium indicum]
MGIGSFLSARLARRVGPEHRSFAVMTGTVLGGVHAACPACRRGQLLPDPGSPALRKCDDPACGATFSLAEMGRTFALDGADARDLAHEARRQAFVLFLAAVLIGVLAAVWAVYAHSWLTLLGAVLLCTVVLASALVQRYRAWQLDRGRMFEARAPLGAFLAAEMNGLIGRGRP